MSAHTTTAESGCCESAIAERTQYIDPICGMPVKGDNSVLCIIHEGVKYYFCSRHCLKMFSTKIDSLKKGEPLIVESKRPVVIGIKGFTALLLIFLSAVFLANENLSAVLVEMRRLWYWVLLLSAGFAFQLGIFVHIRQALQQRMTGATAEVAASGAVSTGSMIACCSHGLVNILPFFGISAAAAFLARYQLPFLLLGVFSNLVGITIMIGLPEKNNIDFSHPLLRGITTFNIKLIRLFLIFIGVVAIGFTIATA